MAAYANRKPTEWTVKQFQNALQDYGFVPPKSIKKKPEVANFIWNCSDSDLQKLHQTGIDADEDIKKFRKTLNDIYEENSRFEMSTRISKTSGKQPKKDVRPVNANAGLFIHRRDNNDLVYSHRLQLERNGMEEAGELLNIMDEHDFADHYVVIRDQTERSFRFTGCVEELVTAVHAVWALKDMNLHDLSNEELGFAVQVVASGRTVDILLGMQLWRPRLGLALEMYGDCGGCGRNPCTMTRDWWPTNEFADDDLGAEERRNARHISYRTEMAGFARAPLPPCASFAIYMSNMGGHLTGYTPD